MNETNSNTEQLYQPGFQLRPVNRIAPTMGAPSRAPTLDRFKLITVARYTENATRSTIRLSIFTTAGGLQLGVTRHL
jgi:hypothetical protein